MGVRRGRAVNARREEIESTRHFEWAHQAPADRRSFLIDVLRCPPFGGIRRVLAAIHDPKSIRRVLSAMGLSSEAPVVAAARGLPEQGEWCRA
jgi:hypothetical protein